MSDKLINEYKDAALPLLPKGWMWVRLGEIIEKIPLTNKKLKQKEYKESGKIPVIDQGKMFISGYTDRVDLKISCSDPIIVFGDHTKVIKYVDFDFVPGADGVKVIRPLKIFFTKLFYYFLHSVELPEKGYARHFQFLEKSYIPLPPLPEQRRIVAKIEELFTKLDAGVEALKKAKEQIKRYRQAVLKYAFEGKLTEEWRKSFELLKLNDELKETQNPQLNIKNSTFKTENSTFTTQNYEPASVLLERIKEERKKKLGRKYKELPPMDTSELPELPEGWVWTRIGDVTEVTPEDNFSNLDPSLPTTFVPMSAIDENTGTIKNPETLPLKEARKGHTHFKENDIIFARITPCMENGKCAIATDLKNGIGFGSTEFIVIRPSRDILPKIIFYFIRQESFRHKAKAHFKSTVGQLRVPKEFMINAEIPLPPLPEQHRIVEEIERRLSIADATEKTIDQCLKQAERLRQSILKKAFEGKLVPQDPNDEPAEKLLERVRKSLEL